MNYQNNQQNYTLIEKLNNLGILGGNITCTCGNTNIKLQKLTRAKINGACFRCSLKKCKKIYSITTNSFFQKFPHSSIYDIYEIIKCMLCLNFNKVQTQKYLFNEKNIIASKTLIGKVFKEVRLVLYYYYCIIYEAEEFGEEGKAEFFACDESLFTKYNNEQIWVLNIINTSTKEFRILATKNRDGNTLKKFIMKYVPPGNNIVTDGWSGYNFLNRNGYIRYEHNHAQGNFGRGVQSTSHSENIWNIFKSDIKANYKSIPCKDFLLFLKEEEFKYCNRHLNYENKILEFFECYKLVNLVGSDYVENEDFLVLKDFETNGQEIIID